jgi:16S rRNA G966 N2-methylase RsmD
MMAHLAQRVARRLRNDGIAKTAHLAAERLYERYREFGLGINTRGHVEWHKLSDDPACKRYQAVPYRCLDIALRALAPEPGQETLLDYGSGKGRVLIQAARHPFRRVIGVERSADLCQAARENVEKARKKLRCQDIEITETDVRNYQVPPDVTVVFLFNPFVGQVLASALDHVHQSLRAIPRKLTLCYLCPQRPDNVFADYPWLALRDRLPAPGTEKLSSFIYEFSPQC